MMNTLQTEVGAIIAQRALRHSGCECAGLRLDAALARLFPEHSRSRLQAWMKEGRVTRRWRRRPMPSARCWGGERVECRGGAAERATFRNGPRTSPCPSSSRTTHLLVIDKPAGLVVHPGSGNWSGTLLNALLHHAPQLAEVPRAGIVHRLDKDTSGLLVVAKTLAAQTDLVRQLQARTVKRHYLALVHGDGGARRHGRCADRPPSGAAHQDGRGQRGGGPRARTHYARARALRRARRWSNAGWKPAARIRFACT